LGNGRSLLEAGGLQARHVSMSEAEAARLAATLWSVHGTARRLATEKDDSFAIVGGDGRYVLKVSNPVEEPAELDFEVTLQRHVWTSARGVAVPELFPSNDDHYLVPVCDEAGQPRYARLMSLVDGTPLDATESTPTEREHVGAMLARLRHATATFRHPAEDRRLAWDVRHLAELAPLLATVDDLGHRDLLERGLDRFAHIAPSLPGLRSQVLHNDFSRSNLIVDHAHPEFVRAVIDFGDAVRTAIAIDVSTALLNQLPRRVDRDRAVDLFADGRDLLRGYLREADLTTDELAVVPTLVMGRVIARALITTSRAALMPANAAYVLRNTEQGWDQLRWLLARSPDQLGSTLIDAPRTTRG
jgi:hydroxylysine kinase